MADEPAAEAVESTQPAASGGGDSKKKLLLGGLVAGVMLLEGVGLYVGMKMFGSGPDEAAAGDGIVGEDKDAASAKPEVPIVKIKVPNRKTGKTYLYDIEVAATINVPEGKTPDAFKPEIETKLTSHENAIRDRLSYLIRTADPQQLDEPGLVMIRRQIKAELDKILGDEKLLDRILIPRWTPLRADM